MHKTFLSGLILMSQKTQCFEICNRLNLPLVKIFIFLAWDQIVVNLDLLTSKFNCLENWNIKEAWERRKTTLCSSPWVRVNSLENIWTTIHSLYRSAVQCWVQLQVVVFQTAEGNGRPESLLTVSLQLTIMMGVVTLT